MSGQWKLGDLAMVTWPVNCDGAFPVVRGKSRWYALDDVRRPHDDDFLTDEFLGRLHATIRPLVVIDPEDREQVARLTEMFWVNGSDDADDPKAMADALRELANPAPPKPEEPTGLGAIVEDASGEKWINFRDPAWPGQHQTPWVRISDTEIAAEYADLTAVKVLSEGVTP